MYFAEKGALILPDVRFGIYQCTIAQNSVCPVLATNKLFYLHYISIVLLAIRYPFQLKVASTIRGVNSTVSIYRGSNHILQDLINARNVLDCLEPVRGQGQGQSDR